MLNIKPRAIIIEDEEHIKDLLCYILESIGFEIAGTADNGKTALELLQKENPDLAIMDINMPYLRGTDVLKKYNCTKDTCIIILTALTDSNTVKECLSLGVSYFIRKDTPVPKIIELIKKTWDNFYKQKTTNSQKEKTTKYDIDKIFSDIKEDDSFEL